MKKWLGILLLLVFTGTVYSQFAETGNGPGYWFGNPLKDKVSAMIYADQSSGNAYVGFYAQKPGLNTTAACNLAIGVGKDGESFLQVVDPETGKFYHLDLLELAKSQNKESE